MVGSIMLVFVIGGFLVVVYVVTHLGKTDLCKVVISIVQKNKNHQ